MHHNYTDSATDKNNVHLYCVQNIIEIHLITYSIFSAADAWANSQPANMAQIQDLEVQCEKDLFRVRIKFDRPFYGMVFSKGYYSNVNCVHVPSGLGQTQATFDIAMGQVREMSSNIFQISFKIFSE